MKQSMRAIFRDMAEIQMPALIWNVSGALFPLYVAYIPTDTTYNFTLMETKALGGALDRMANILVCPF